MIHMLRNGRVESGVGVLNDDIEQGVLHPFRNLFSLRPRSATSDVREQDEILRTFSFEAAFPAAACKSFHRE